jgi:hypothetical protein
MKIAIGIGAAVGLYYLWSRGYIAQLFNGTPNGVPTVVDAGGAGVGMTVGGQAATVYGGGRQLGITVPAPTFTIQPAPFPITAPTPTNPFTGAVKAAAAAAFKMPPAPAPGMPPSRLLVPVVRGTAAATAIT